MEILNHFITLLHWLMKAGAALFSLGGLFILLWAAMMKQRDYTYRKTAKTGTPCRYWDGEIRNEGRIIKLENGVATIKDFFSGEIIYRTLKDTAAL